MKPVSVQLAVLRRARDLAGGVSYLARKVQMNADVLDEMLHGHAAIPPWLFLRVLDYVDEAEASGAVPDGFPPDWDDDAKKQKGV